MDRFETGATIKRLIADGCDATRDGHARDVGAIVERLTTNGGNALRKHYGF